MSNDLIFSEAMLRDAALNGVREAVRQALGSNYGNGDRLKAAVVKACHEIEPEVGEAVKRAIRMALASDDFALAVRNQLLQNLGNKIGGAFHGTVIAAGKAMANDPQVTAAVRQAAVQALAGHAP